MARYEDEFAHRFTSSGADKVSRDMSGMGRAAGPMTGIMDRAGSAFAFLGPRIEALGDKMNTVSKEWVNTYKQAELVDIRLRSLAKNQGWSDAQVKSVEDMSAAMMMKSGFKETEIRQAAVEMLNFGMNADQINRIMPMLVRQARTLGEPIESLGMGMGKAFGSGNLGALKRMGVTIDDATFAMWKARAASTNWADPMQAAATRALVFEGALKGIDQTAMPLDAIMSAAAARGDLVAAKYEKVSATLGEGARAVLKYRNQVLGMAYDWGIAHPEMTKNIGTATALTGTVIKGAGAVGSFAHDWVGFAASLKIAKSGKEALNVATKAEALSEKDKIGIAGREAKALEGVTQKAGGLGKQMTSLQKAGSWMTGGLGFGGLMGSNAGAALTGGLGAGAALTSVTLMAGTAVLGWEVGQAIAGWLEKETGYQEKGGDWLADYAYGAGKQEKWAGTAATQDEIQAARDRAHGVRNDKMKSGQQMQNEHAASVAFIPGYGAYSMSTNPRSTPTARPTPGGDLTVRIPGDKVVTRQGVADRRALGA
jgi:hypothetical protein